MKKFVLILALISLCHCDESLDCTSTNNMKKRVCESIKFDGVNNCIYDGTDCKEGYTECEKYRPENNADFVDKECTKIVPTNLIYKCVISENAGKKYCTKTLKSCDEYSSTKGHCIDLFAVQGSRCVLIGEKCESHKDECSGLTEEKCNSNIPKNKNKKCLWSGTSCSEEDRTCKDLIAYEDEEGKSAECFSLKPSDTTKICFLNGGTCTEDVKDCSVGQNEDSCIKIKPLKEDKTGYDLYSKCSYSEGKCKKEEKMCEDSAKSEFTSDAQCKLLKITNSEKKYCGYDSSQEICKEYYRNCYDVNEEEEDKRKSACEDIITPMDYYDNKDIYSKCVYEEYLKECQNRHKPCSEYNSDPTLCNAYTTISTLKKCIHTGSECKEIYKSCYDYNFDRANKEKTKEQCNEIVFTDSPYIKCSYDNTLEIDKCAMIKRECNELDIDICEKHILDNSHKRCIHIGSECKEVYKTCDDYNADTETKDKTDDLCTEIEPEEDPDYSECFIFTNDKNEKICKKRKKDCYKLNDEYCNSQELENKSKRCLYNQNKQECETVYKTCENFNRETVNTEKIESNCTKIKPLYDNDQHIYKCDYNEGTCSQKKIICGEDYEGNDEEYCESLSINLDDGDKYKCALDKKKDYTCNKVYKACNKYDGTEREECKLIDAEGENNICDFDANNKCFERPLACSDFSEYQCNYYYDDDKYCEYDGNACVEKIVYHQCNDYKGDKKKDCERIQPYDLKNKCIYSDNTNTCTQTLKECKDAENINECQSITPSDNKKQCLWDSKNKCFESYKTCQLYQDNVQSMNKDDCETIVIKDSTNTYSPLTHECKFESDSCVTKPKGCSAFDASFIINQCQSLQQYSLYTDKTKKCVYDESNISCSLKGKTCLEMEEAKYVDEETCQNAATSASNKVCQYNEDKEGCEEVDKKQSSAVINEISIILLITLCLII